MSYMLQLVFQTSFNLTLISVFAIQQFEILMFQSTIFLFTLLGIEIEL